MNPQSQESSEFEVLQPGALDVIERAQIDVQIATAKRYPRDVVSVKKKIISLATMDEETAASCFFTLERWDAKEQKKKLIPGPSVRLAEIAVYAFGNTRSGARVVDNDGHFVSAQGLCHDLESNNMISMTTQRRITNKDGKTFTEDMQVVTGNAASAIAWRNAVLKVIPRSLYWSAYEAARQVAVGDATTLREKRDKIIKRFASMGVALEQILAKVDKRHVEEIDLEQLEALIGIGTKIKEGHSSVEEEFEPIQDPRAGKEAAGRAGVEKLIQVGNLAAAKAMAKDLKLDFDAIKADLEKKTASAPKPESKDNPSQQSASGEKVGANTTAPAESSAPSGEATAEPSATVESPTPESKVDPEKDKQLFREAKLKKLREDLGAEEFWRVIGGAGCEDIPMAVASPQYDDLIKSLDQTLKDLKKAGAKSGRLKL